MTKASPRKFFSRLALSALLLAVTIGAVGAHVVYVKLHRSLPQSSGRLALPGLEAPVDILRDKWGVPHIYAANRHDALFAEGFVHAQDRLWQMELGRRLGRGRLSELLGKPALNTDRLMRAYDFAGLAKRLLPTLPEPARNALIAYTSGVNAYLQTRKGILPPEFLIAGLDKPEPWTPEDSIILIKLMAVQLSMNGSELAHALLMKSVSPEVFAALNPDLPPLPALTALYEVPLPSKQSALEQTIQGASNNWVVDGRWTRSGKPLLANDPHLGLTIPVIWYLAHLSAEGRNIVGASLAGVPGIILGRNDTLAWAYTNTGSDVQDYYLEKIAPETPEHYVSPDGARPFGQRSETIKIRNAPSLTEVFRTTAHGPVLPSDLPLLRNLVPKDHVLAIDWDALKDGDQTIAAGLALTQADSTEAFMRDLESYVAPMQNMVIADTAGHIGFIAPGHVPVRLPMNDTKGLLPAPGWKPGYDWAGIIPFYDLPRKIDPPDGFIVTANNNVVGPDYPYTLTYEWDRPQRAERITQLIQARHDHDTASFEAMQRDTVSLSARALTPKLLASLNRNPQQDPLAADAIRRLSTWDGAMGEARPEPYIYAAWIYETERALLINAAGAENYRLLAGWRTDLIGLVLDGAAAQHRFCGEAGCDALIRQAFEDALRLIASEQGNRVGQWRWGLAHQAQMSNEPFGQVPLLGPLLNRHVASGGGADTIDRGLTRFSSAEPFANVHGSTYRAIYDLAEHGKSVFMISTGQSGNPLSRHYDDLMPLWARGDYIPMDTDRAAVEAEKPEVLRLTPAGAP